MKKRDYEKPSMKVVELQQRQHLMAGSVEATRNGYGVANQGMSADEDTWD